MTDREKLINKIKALLELANPARGGTEAEALLAAEKAAELMAKHGIAMADAKSATGEEFETALRAACAQREFQMTAKLAFAVAAFCNAGAYTVEHKQAITFYGPTSACVFANWLLDMLLEFIERGAYDYMMSDRPDTHIQQDMFGELSRKARRAAMANDQVAFAFKVAAVDRIYQRLYDLARKRRDFHDTQHRLRDELARHKGISPSPTFNTKLPPGSDRRAQQAGLRRGDTATFNQPVNGGNAVHQIERRRV